MKKYSSYNKGPFKIENEPEEGEIVDDYDLIVSSDEELSMRQRIRELEAKNDEIEQIAVISESYVDKINHSQNNLESSRAAKVPTDVSSISSTEFTTPKKEKRRKSREYKRKHYHRQRHHYQYEQYRRYDLQKIPLKTRLKRTPCKRRQKLYTNRYKQFYYDRFVHKDLIEETLSFDSLESSDSNDSLSDSKYYCNNKMAFGSDKYITRDTLRLAVARNMNEPRIPNFKTSCLKDKLLRQDLVGHSLNPAFIQRESLAERPDIHGDNNDDDDVQIIENDQVIQTIDEDSTQSTEEQELRLIALKSAVLNKHHARKVRNAEVAYSPTDFDEMLSSENLHQDNNRLNDIDVVELEAEDLQPGCVTISPEASPQLMMLDDQDESQQMVDCKPVDMDIVNSDSEGATIDSWSKDVAPSLPKFLESHEFANSRYSFYMQDLHDLPSPPPGVDDYVDVPPPPPCTMLYNAESQDMDLDEELVDNQQKTEDNVEKDKQVCADTIKEDEETEDKEEEEALRALLLSKFQSPKNQRKIKKSTAASEDRDTSTKNEVCENINFKSKPTEIILKEAVKRLKIHSQNEPNKEEMPDVFCNESRNVNDNKPQEQSVNSSDALNPLQKLRIHLSNCTNQSQSINTDHMESRSESICEQKVEQDIVANTNNNDCKEQADEPNSLEMANTMDISDITRRLEKIKERVLSKNFNVSPQAYPPKLSSTPLPVDEVHPANSLCFKRTENIVECSQSSGEDTCRFNQHLVANASFNIIPANNGFSTEQTPKKTVKADFDVASNQTTFKVIITNNNSAFKLENNEIPNSPNSVVCKEKNNTKSLSNSNNNNNNNLTMKLNGHAASSNKIAASNGRLVQMSNAQVNKSFAVAKPIVKNVKKVNPAAIYSTLRTAKIVKPNKVINANYEMNLNLNLAKQLTQTSENKSLLKASASDNSRLITSVEQVKHMCSVAPIVISVQNSSNESTDCEGDRDGDLMYKPLYDYNDNDSPLSLNLESPSRTPLRSNSPAEPADGSTKHTDSEAFNLKTSATPVAVSKYAINKTQSKPQPRAQAQAQAHTPQTYLAVNIPKTNKTPLAVRNLPAEAQNEYRMLVHRMKLLENKRKIAELEERRNECSAEKKKCSNFPTVEDCSEEKDLKNSLVKKVLLRNAANDAPQISLKAAPCNTSKLQKTTVLRSYENLYIKFGAGILNNLDKSLKLVEEAKHAKIAKLKLENRLKELKAEMDILQAKHKEEQQKISRIYPSICATNDVITSLKQKRSKVFKAALNLGKTLNGEDYRLKNDLKGSITAKSKTLATEIKIVNSLKAQDIKNIENVINANKTTDQQTEEKKEIVGEERRISCKGEESIEIEIKQNPNTAESIKQDEVVEPNPESPLNKDVCGNKEFQSLDNNNSKSDNDAGETCPLDTDVIESNNADRKEGGAGKPSPLSLYISPLDHLRNIDSNLDPNGVICPYDLMGNCEDVSCKYVHITAKVKT